MINLLPQKDKDALLLKRKRSLAIILGCVLTISAVCLIFVLVSLKFYIMAEIDNQKFLSQSTEKSYQSPNIENIKDAIQRYNSLLPAILSFYQRGIYSSDVLATVSQIQKPEGLYFTNISLSSMEPEKKVKVSISGISDTRENLLVFQKNMEKEANIKNIFFSADSWINPVKASFNLTFEYGN